MSIELVVLVVFVTLKLAGVIGWSWVWVLAPLWVTMMLHVFFRLVSHD